jgi:FkbM family methyltransferase
MQQIQQRESYSQNNEQSVILDYINQLGIKNGKFIDIGAFHPKVFSNTRALYEDGWNGVIYEPSPICFKEFTKEYEFNTKMILNNLAVSSLDEEEIDFYESNGDAISTTEISHKEKWEHSGVEYTKIKVKTISVKTIMSTHGNDTDFISIDVESKNLDLFNLIHPLLNNSSLKMLCIEHDGYYDYMIAKMAEINFRCVLYNNENLLFIKNI